MCQGLCGEVSYGYGAGFPHAWYGWLRAGWTIAAVDLGAATVTFARTGGAV